VLGTCDDYGACHAIDFLMGLGANLKAHAARIRRLQKTMAEQGISRLPDSICHNVDIPEEIWELRTHRLRAFFFFDGDHTFIFTNGLPKKRDEIRPQDKQMSINLKRKYFHDQSEGKLEYLPALEEES